MPHRDMTEAQWREFVVARFGDGDRRFASMEQGQKTMNAKLEENTKITQKALDISEATDGKVDALIATSERVSTKRHTENIARFEALDKSIVGASSAAQKAASRAAADAQKAASEASANALAAKASAEKTQEDVAGLLDIYRGGKAGIKVVRGIAVSIKGIILYAAAAIGGVAFITACVLFLLGKGALPPLFWH